MGTLSRNIIMKVCVLTLSLVFFILTINRVLSEKNKKKYYLVELKNKKGIKPPNKHRGGRDYELTQSDINDLFSDTNWQTTESKRGNNAKEEEEESAEWREVDIDDVEEKPAKELLDKLFP